jgi:hypothetical protein
MTRLIIILIIAGFNLFCSCKKAIDKDTLIQIYKFKSTDYSNNVTVELSDDKKKLLQHLEILPECPYNLLITII